MQLLTEKEENEIFFEVFPVVYNSAVFLRILFKKKKTFVLRSLQKRTKDGLTIFRKEEKMKKLIFVIVFLGMTGVSQATWNMEFIAYSHADNSLYKLSGPTLQSTKIGTLETESYPITNNGGLSELLKIQPI